ncbi:MAG: O-antigen ligase family protein [Lachnospiraceae bacterium]|nr:O-antigen ligase family protein [Lachnospiraceae bacterium]
MAKQGKAAHENNERTLILQDRLAFIPLVLMMIFYAGTWSFPYFYHITEKYNSLIIFIALFLLLLIKGNILDRLRKKDISLILTGLALVIAFANLLIIGSNLGCILILADFLLVIYIGGRISLSEFQMKMLEVFFLLMYASWFIYDRAFSYNSNTGATYTVFTLFAALMFLSGLTRKNILFGYLIVAAFLRTFTLILWHLARGAFMALVFFVFFYFLFLFFDPARHRKKYVFLSCFAVFGSLLFVWAYVMLARTGFNAQMPFFYKSIFSGREDIWAEIWDMLKGHIFTGIGSGYELKSFFEYNIHNAMYDILAVHGILVFAISAFLIINTLASAGKNIKRDRKSLIAAAAIFAIFFESFIDMDLMWADYSPVLLLLFLEVFRDRAEQEN